MDTIQALRDSTLFSDVEGHHLEAIAAFSEEQEYGLDEIIFHRGGELQHLYVVVSGAIELSMEPVSNAGTVHPFTYNEGPGGVFGWSSVSAQSIATLSASAAQESRVVAIDAQRLQGYMAAHPAFGFHVMVGLLGLVSARLRLIQEAVAS